MAVVTFTTDFGWVDAYVGAMKGVVLTLAPDTALVDITHQVSRHDVVAGAWILSQAAPYFPPGSIHVAVVDPGVGGERADLVVEASGQIFVGPDNGVLSLAASRPRRIFRIENPLFRREHASPTFHGRDVFAVAAGRLAAGHAAREVGAEVETMVECQAGMPVPLGDDSRGQVVHIDTFGNLITSLHADGIAGSWLVTLANATLLAKGGRTFSDVASGDWVLYPGSSGRIELAVRDGSAAEQGLAKVGSPITLRRIP